MSINNLIILIGILLFLCHITIIFEINKLYDLLKKKSPQVIQKYNLKNTDGFDFFIVWDIAVFKLLRILLSSDLKRIRDSKVANTKQRLIYLTITEQVLFLVLIAITLYLINF